MQVANILSDLTSLLICENHEAAHRLVSARPPNTNDKSAGRKGSQGRRSSGQPLTAEKDVKGSATSDDPDPARAYTFMKLHREVKKAYAFGNDGPAGSNGLSELMESRENVRKAIERLGLDAGVEAQESPDGAKQSEGNDPTDANAEGDDEDISAWA